LIVVIFLSSYKTEDVQCMVKYHLSLISPHKSLDDELEMQNLKEIQNKGEDTYSF